MARIGDRFRTGDKCPTSGSYVFDAYADGTDTLAPEKGERVIPLKANQTFPLIRSDGFSKKHAYWKLQRIA